MALKTLSRPCAIFLVFAILAGIFGPVSAGAESERLVPRSEITLNELGLHDLTAYGGAPKLDIWFPGYGDYALADGSYLQLEYDHSEVVYPVNSTVTVLLNDIPIATTFLNEQNTTRTSWRISLPRDRLKRDLNHIELRYRMRLSDDECVDNESLALYSTVYAESYIHYEYARPLRFLGLPPLDLGRLPEPFLRPEIRAGEIAFIVPDEPSLTDLSAAASIAARFGQLARGKPLDVTLYRASSASKQVLTQKDLVVIGQPGANAILRDLAPSFPLRLDTEREPALFVDQFGVPIEPSNGIVQEFVSPYDERFAILIVSGNGEDGLRRAASVLASREGAKHLRGRYTVIANATDEALGRQDRASDGYVRTVTLQQLGIADWQAIGVGQHSFSFSFDAPPPGDQPAFLELVLSRSPILDQDRSSLAIFLNGSPIRSILLKGENAEWQSQRIPLPAGSMRPGINAITLRLSLYTRYAEECGPLAGERAWAVVRSESALVLPIGPEPSSLVLANLPYPFLKGGEPREVFLLLPAEDSLLESSLQIAVALGRQTLGGSTEMRAGLSTMFDVEEGKRKHVIAYALAGDDPTITTIRGNLPLRLEELERSLWQQEAALLAVKDAADIGIIQLTPSPLANDRALLTLDGRSPSVLKRAVQALAGPLPRAKAAIIGEDGRVTGIEIPSPPSVEGAETIAELGPARISAAVVTALTLMFLGSLAFRNRGR